MTNLRSQLISRPEFTPKLKKCDKLKLQLSMGLEEKGNLEVENCCSSGLRLGSMM